MFLSFPLAFLSFPLAFLSRCSSVPARSSSVPAWCLRSWPFGFPSVFLHISFGFPLAPPLFPLVFLWGRGGGASVFVWCSFGVRPVLALWFSCEFPPLPVATRLVFVGCFGVRLVFHLAFLWLSSGFPLVSLWLPFRFPLVSF